MPFRNSLSFLKTTPLLAGVLLFGLGCSDTSIGGGNPLSITLTVDPAVGAAAADTFTFQYEATGTDLLGVVLHFGDGQVDSLSALGAVTASATRLHTYEDPGTYSAIASAVEAVGGTLADTVSVEVQLP